MDTRYHEMANLELWAERQKFQAWIDGPENDGRLTSGSSAQLDYCSDMVEDIDAELERRCEDYCKMTDDKLRARRQEIQAWLDNPQDNHPAIDENDPYWDFWFYSARLEDIDAELKRRSEKHGYCKMTDDELRAKRQEAQARLEGWNRYLGHRWNDAYWHTIRDIDAELERR